jgi:hypothetical protein
LPRPPPQKNRTQMIGKYHAAAGKSAALRSRVTETWTVQTEAVMNQSPIDLCEEQIEERLLQALMWSDVLPYADLKARAAARADDVTFRRVLDELIASGLVQRRAARKSLWYFGYTQAQADHEASLDDIPAPFREYLSALIW